MEEMRSKVRQLTQALQEQGSPDSGYRRRTSSVVLEDGQTGQAGGAQGAAGGGGTELPPEYVRSLPLCHASNEEPFGVVCLIAATPGSFDGVCA